ncbi:hypothetical protein KBB27_01405 [Patescibacteria group bacterium]|nr:hypothetical protein [Patescibacteria group bacterium]
MNGFFEKRDNVLTTHERTTPTRFEKTRQERLLENLHASALAGTHLLSYLETAPFPSLEDFLDTQKYQDPLPEYTQVFFRETIRRWNQLQLRVDELLSTIHRELIQSEIESNDQETIKRLFSLRGCGRDPVGRVRLSRKGAYLIIVCDTIEDYSSFYHGQASPQNIHSAGTYHKAIPFIWKQAPQQMEEAPWDPDSNEPPPLPAEDIIKQYVEIPILLIRPSEVHDLETVIQHEQQHFLNDAFSSLYDGHEEQGKTSFERLQDEVLAGIREGASGEVLRRRLGKQRGATYTRFIGGTQTETEIHEQTLKEIASALDEPFIASLFNSIPNRTVLAFHLMHVPLERIAYRIRILGAYFRKRILLDPIEAHPERMPFDVERLVNAAPPALQSVYYQEGNALLLSYKTYQNALQEIVLETDHNRSNTTLIQSYERYLVDRERLAHKVLSWCSSEELAYTLTTQTQTEPYQFPPPLSS